MSNTSERTALAAIELRLIAEFPAVAASDVTATTGAGPTTADGSSSGDEPTTTGSAAASYTADIQPIWDARINWASNTYAFTDVVWWTGAGIAANTYPYWFYQYYLTSQPLLTAGVVLADGLVGASSLTGKTGLFTPTATLNTWLVGGSGQLLAELG